MKVLSRECYINEDPPDIKEEKEHLKESLESIIKVKPDRKKHLVNISLNYPNLYDECIKDLVFSGFYPSRSEAVRTAIRQFLQKEYKELELLGYFKNRRFK